LIELNPAYIFSILSAIGCFFFRQTPNLEEISETVRFGPQHTITITRVDTFQMEQIPRLLPAIFRNQNNGNKRNFFPRIMPVN